MVDLQYLHQTAFKLLTAKLFLYPTPLARGHHLPKFCWYYIPRIEMSTDCKACPVIKSYFFRHELMISRRVHPASCSVVHGLKTSAQVEHVRNASESNMHLWMESNCLDSSCVFSAAARAPFWLPAPKLCT